MDTFTKQSTETIDYSFDFSLALETGDTLASAATTTVANVRASPPVGDVLPTIGTKTVSSTAVKQRVSGGTNGQTYELTSLATTAAGEVLEHNFKLKIKDV